MVCFANIWASSHFVLHLSVSLCALVSLSWLNRRIPASTCDELNLIRGLAYAGCIWTTACALLVDHVGPLAGNILGCSVLVAWLALLSLGVRWLWFHKEDNVLSFISPQLFAPSKRSRQGTLTHQHSSSTWVEAAKSARQSRLSARQSTATSDRRRKHFLSIQIEEANAKMASPSFNGLPTHTRSKYKQMH